MVESTTNTGNGSASSFDNNLANVSSNIIENSRNSNSNNNNSGGNAEIINSYDGSSGGSETGSGNTILSSPVEPQKPSRPGPEAPSGMIYYKDYGSFDGCSAESRNVAKTNVKTMVNTLCDSCGYMYYTPKG